MNHQEVIKLKTAPDITFSDLTLKVKGLFEDEKTVLNKVSGSFPSGSFVGIFGPSGAGKSSLLNILSGWCKGGKVSGSVYLDGRVQEAQLHKISAYVTQDCHLNDLLTVQENLLFAADFKMGGNVSDGYKLDLIDDILQQFNLHKKRHTKTKHLSGGQRKRLSICQELIHKPDIVFCDEPTTGLDIVSSLQCVKYFKEITQKGHTVICTIHQPTNQIYNMFDIVYVVAKGRRIYQGGPKEIITFLERAGIPCNIFHSPIDEVIDICTGEHGRAKAELLFHAENKSTMTPTNCTSSCNEQFGSHFEHTGQPMMVTNCYKFRTLLQREYIKAKRDIFSTYLRIIGMNLVASMISSIYWNAGEDAYSLLFMYNLILCINANIMFATFLFPILIFPNEMELTKREIFNNYYNPMQYYIATIIIELPVTIVSIATSSLVIYYCTGQALETHRILLLLVFSCLLGMTMNAMGFFLGTLFSVKIALVTAVVTNLPIWIIGGFGIVIADLPHFTDCVSLLMYTRHSVMGTAVAILGLNHPPVPCPDKHIFCLYTDPERLLLDFGINPNEYITSLSVLIAWITVFRVLSYFSTKYRLSST